MWYTIPMKQYILGALALAFGIFMVIKSEAFLRVCGRIDWAEEHFSNSGGSRLMYKLMGIIVIIFALLAVTGQFGDVAGGALKKLFVR